MNQIKTEMIRNIYLNDFRGNVVRNVVRELLDRDTELVVAQNLGLSLHSAQKRDHLVLSYESMLHRLFIQDLDLDAPIFSNPNAICELASRQEFMNAVKITDEYKLIISK